jgi:hypothetical protein
LNDQLLAGAATAGNEEKPSQPAPRGAAGDTEEAHR